MGLFKKNKEEKKDLTKDIFEKINKDKLEICYFDNEHLTMVPNQIPLQQGYYVRKYKEHISQVKLERNVYPDFFSAFCSIG